MLKRVGQDGSLLVHRSRVRARARASFEPRAPEFPLSISLSSAYKVGANNLLTGESFGYEKRAAKWLEVFRALHTFEEELTYYASLLVRLRI